MESHNFANMLDGGSKSVKGFLPNINLSNGISKK